MLPPAPGHGRGCLPRAQERAPHVHREHAVPLVEVDLVVALAADQQGRARHQAIDRRRPPRTASATCGRVAHVADDVAALQVGGEHARRRAAAARRPVGTDAAGRHR